MSFNFPDNPVTGQIFQPEFGPQYVFYDGKWRDAVALGVPPATPLAFKSVSLLNGPEPYMGGVEWDVATEEDANLWKIKLFRAPAGTPIGAQHWVSDTDTPRPGDTYRIGHGKVLVNAALAAPLSPARQWSQSPAGQFNHANTLLNNKAAVSLDGINWRATVAADADQATTWRALAYSPTVGTGKGRILAVASAGTQRSMYSDDGGETWTLGNIPTSGWYAVLWVPELSLFVACTNAIAANAYTSPTGVGWTSRTKPTTINVRGMCWANNLTPTPLIITVGDQGGAQHVMTSPDGINWTARNTPADQQWLSVAWSPTLKIAVAVSATGTNRLMTSTDGVNWTLRPSGNDGGAWAKVIWAPEMAMFVATASAGSTGIRSMHSSDGINWVADGNITAISWNDVAGGPLAGGGGQVVAVCSVGAGSWRMMGSNDAVTWFSRPNVPNNNNWQANLYCGAPLNQWVAVASGSPGINPELLSWGGLGLKIGEWARYATDVVTPDANLSYQYNNPGRNLGGAMFTTTGKRNARAQMVADADAFGFFANTDRLAALKTIGVAREIPGFSYVGQGIYDYGLAPVDLNGVQGPMVTFPGVWIG